MVVIQPELWWRLELLEPMVFKLVATAHETETEPPSSATNPCAVKIRFQVTQIVREAPGVVLPGTINPAGGIKSR